MCGFGRAGKWFAVEHWDVIPDILVAAKGVSGGYAPLSVLIAHARIVGALRDAGTPWVAGHTYAQNPVSAAAGLAVLEYLQRHDLARTAAERGAQLRSGLEALIARHRILGDVRGLGLMLGVELVRNQQTREPFPLEDGIAFKFGRACIEEGVAVYPGQSGADGQVGDHALVTPPLVITADQVQALIAGVDRALTRLEATLP
jgi:adenosylmethionine-8-amino-7-oxononanoate aminotransferase